MPRKQPPKQTKPVRPHEAARFVHQKMKENQAAYGSLTELNIGLMLEFTKYLFKCPRSLIAIEPDSTQIYLAPVINSDGPEAFYTQEQFDAALKTFNVRHHEPALPKFFILPAYTIEFIREIKEPS